MIISSRICPKKSNFFFKSFIDFTFIIEINLFNQFGLKDLALTIIIVIITIALLLF